MGKMNMRYCGSRSEVDTVLEHVYQCCGYSLLVADNGEPAADQRPGFWVFYSDDVPDHGIEVRLGIRDLLHHLYQCGAEWTSLSGAAQRLGLKISVAGSLVEHCVHQGWVERGDSGSALRITQAGRRALERTRPD